MYTSFTEGFNKVYSEERQPATDKGPYDAAHCLSGLGFSTKPPGLPAQALLVRRTCFPLVAIFFLSRLLTIRLRRTAPSFAAATLKVGVPWTQSVWQ